MALFYIPDSITVTFKLDAETLALIERIIDVADDREAARKLSTEVKAQAGALAAVVPSP